MSDDGKDRRLSALVVMGVSGSGKSTLGRRLAEALQAPFLEGDEYHSVANVEKMKAGMALEDDDRWPWLESLGRTIGRAVVEHGRVVAACSALKRVYRDRLRQTSGVPLLFVCLRADALLLDARIGTRRGHFFPSSLLSSQLATLEQPHTSEDALCLDSGEPIESLLAAVLAELDQRAARARESSHTIAPGGG